MSNSYPFDGANQVLTSIDEEKPGFETPISSTKLNKKSFFTVTDVENSVPLKSRNTDPDILQSSKSCSIVMPVHIIQSNFEHEFEKDSIHSNGSLKIKHVSSVSNLCDSFNRRHSLPSYALDKVKHFLAPKSPSTHTQLFSTESLISKRKKSIIGLFNTIGTNLGLVSPKKCIGNGVLISALHGSSGSMDIARMRHSLGILEMDQISKNALPTIPITSIDDIYYRPHRSFARDILCCICFKKHDEYDNLIESHSCARIFTALVLLTIVCMLIGYIIKAAGEKK